MGSLIAFSLCPPANHRDVLAVLDDIAVLVHELDELGDDPHAGLALALALGDRAPAGAHRVAEVDRARERPLIPRECRHTRALRVVGAPGEPLRDRKAEETMRCLLYTSPSPRDGLLSRM